MGNGNSATITIDLDQTNLCYFTGETISGIVGLNVTEEKIEADEIYIQLTGEIGYKQIRRDLNNRIERTDYHNVPFYSAKHVFQKPKDGEKEIVYNPGKYSWPFQFPPLTIHLPPSINEPNLYPHVRYYLQVVIDKPWYKPNTRETKYLTVYPRVNLLQNPQCLSSSIFENQNRKDITLKCTLNKTGYVPGEIIHITLEIKNPEKVSIQSIDCSMVQLYHIGQDSRERNIFQTTLPNIMNFKDEEIKETYFVKIPSTTLPPSHQFQGGIQSFACVNIYYILRFTVEVEGIFTNFDVDAPITLGTEPNPDLEQEQTLKPLIVFNSSKSE